MIEKTVSIPLEQGGVFRLNLSALIALIVGSQSLWNRAGSFDINRISFSHYSCVSIPLEQGGVFRQLLVQLLL